MTKPVLYASTPCVTSVLFRYALVLPSMAARAYAYKTGFYSAKLILFTKNILKIFHPPKILSESDWSLKDIKSF